MLLEQGLTYKNITIPNDTAQYLESRTFQKEEIASIFRVSPHLVNLMKSATFGNIEHQGINFITNTMQSWVKRFEQPLTILLQEEDDSLYVSFNMDAYKRGDVESRYNANRTAIESGWKTRNEVRIQEGLNPLDGLDDPILPLNMGGVNEQ
jgi:HK97 family phage portal protein